ncbi:MAG TPA: hypothetical protein VGO06_08590 [Bosea sp. (in: a-proteobacteria)]|jgi:hypothetical protein|uniref:hypothetical protein n=1 Tax=Bosea sp. (in: a-proteobacteria) TaxID=1871050 RepID=UPI002E16052B|nr:hypothetical protein [Bosea sp. (in: a-proteobacteria)]
MGKFFQIKEAVKVAAKAFHDVMRDERYLRWKSSSEEYRAQILDLVRPAATAAFAAGYNQALREAVDAVRRMALAEQEIGGPYTADLLEKAAAAIEALAKP